MCTLTVFHARMHTNRNTNALIHSHMYSQFNPVSCNKKAALLRFAEVHTFFKYSLREGPAADEKPG